MGCGRRRRGTMASRAVSQGLGYVGVEARIIGMPTLPRSWVNTLPDQHVTIKWGLLRCLVREDDVLEALDGWKPPRRHTGPMWLEKFGQHMVLRIDSPAFLDANRRLSRLPHVDTFPVYQPHVTIAQVAYKQWGRVERLLESCVPALSIEFGKTIITKL